MEPMEFVLANPEITIDEIIQKILDYRYKVLLPTTRDKNGDVIPMGKSIPKEVLAYSTDLKYCVVFTNRRYYFRRLYAMPVKVVLRGEDIRINTWDGETIGIIRLY